MSFPKIPSNPLRKSYILKTNGRLNRLALCLSLMNEIHRCAQPRETVPNENSVWRAGGFSVRTVTRRAARVPNLRTESENVRTSEHRCSGCRRNGRLKIMSTYPIFRLLVVRSDGAVHPLGERPRPARFRVVEPGAFRVSLSPGIGAFWIGGSRGIE